MYEIGLMINLVFPTFKWYCDAEWFLFLQSYNLYERGNNKQEKFN